jgi:hypothetical protein
VAGRGSHLLVLSLSGGKVHHQDPLHLKCGLAPRRCMQLECGSGLLASELASQWRCLLLASGLLSTSLHWLPPVMSMISFKREANYRPGCRCSWGDRPRGLSSQIILHPWCGCDGSEQSPHAVPPRRGEAEALFPG